MLNAGKRWTGRMVILMTITYWFNFRDFLNIQRIANLHWRLLLPNGWMELLSMAIVIEKWPKSISHEICLLLNSFGCIKGRQWDKKKWIRPARGMDTSRIERMNKRANLHTMFYFDRFILPDLKWNINKKSIEVKHGKKNISKRFKGFFYFCFISSSVIKDLIFNLGQSNWLCLCTYEWNALKRSGLTSNACLPLCLLDFTISAISMLNLQRLWIPIQTSCFCYAPCTLCEHIVSTFAFCIKRGLFNSFLSASRNFLFYCAY